MAIKSFGTRLWVDGDAVGSLTSMEFSGREATIIDVTTHQSANTSREFIGGLITPPTLGLEGFYVLADAGQAQIRDNLGSEYKCLLVFSDSSGFAFDGVMQSAGEANPLDEAVGFSAQIQLNKGTKFVYPNITIGGTLTSDGSTPATFSTMLFYGIANKRAKWVNNLTTPTQTLAWSGSAWVLTHNTGAVWSSSDNELTPDVATGWAATGPATGTPTFTGS